MSYDEQNLRLVVIHMKFMKMTSREGFSVIKREGIESLFYYDLCLLSEHMLMSSRRINVNYTTSCPRWEYTLLPEEDDGNFKIRSEIGFMFTYKIMLLSLH